MADLLGMIAILSPFILAALLIAGAVVGSFLSPERRLATERYVFGPALILVAVGAAALAASQQEWLRAGLMAGAGLILGRRLLRGGRAQTKLKRTGASA